MRWSEGKTFLRRPSDKEVQSILLGYSALLGRICIVIFVLFAGATRMWSKGYAFGVHKGLSCPDCFLWEWLSSWQATEIQKMVPRFIWLM